MSKQRFSRISTTLFDVWLVTAISTSFMAGTGLKKWSPAKFSGLAMTGSKSDRRIEEVLVRIIASLENFRYSNKL